MRAAVTTRFGPPEVVEVREVPTPTPADNEVLVRVHASSVCFGDRMLRSGPFIIRLLSGFRPRRPILGVDLAGTVESVGADVTRFAPGDAVYGARGDTFAAHAEFACVAEDGFLARKPASMTFEEAGTVFVGAACSLYFLRRANVKPGERVLVHGASGSLGVFAVQLAKHFGAHVTAVCGSANAPLERSLGADEVIDYTAQDFTDGGPAYDVIVDVLGKARLPRSLRALKPGGRYLLVGFSGGLWGIMRALVAGAFAHVVGRARFITGAADPKQPDLVFLQELIDAGKLRTVIGRRYALDEIVEAHRYADSGHKIGNVAVLIRNATEHLRTANAEEVKAFFYGLFMDESLLASKGVGVSQSTVGYVDGYGLRIGRRATLVPDPANRAYGVLMTLRAADLSTLYSDESVADYVSEPVSVVLPDGAVESAVCYNLPKHRLAGANPEYANALLVLAVRLGLPDDYLQQIRDQVA